MAANSLTSYQCSVSDTVKHIRILHLSDTHGKHREIEEKFPLPDADIILYTGDFTNGSTDSEFIDFNMWCGELRSRFKHIVVIAGNHEYSHVDDLSSVFHREYLERRMTDNGKMPLHCKVLEHETYVIDGLRIFGSPWVPWHTNGAVERKLNDSVLDMARVINPETPDHFFDLIPPNIDILMTHGPPNKIFDSTGDGGRWGGSKELSKAIYRARPKAHLFGHLHEQRGSWIRDGEGFTGGVEFKLEAAETSPCVFDYNSPPPPSDYPVEFTSCNAMLNNYKHERCQLEHDGSSRTIGRKIAGGGRLIIAERLKLGESWSFTNG
jgi:Icc-related predicted phosphoesterase